MIEQTIERFTDIFCPQCGEHAEDMTPVGWQGLGPAPGYRHVIDRTALCPVPTRGGDRPAEPVEHTAHGVGAGA